MTKEAALCRFFCGFGIPAYVSTNVKTVTGDDVTFPYLTYEPATSALDEGEVNITVNLWYFGEDEEAANAKARELSLAIGRGGRILRCDGGAIWLKRGDPWCQNLNDEADIRIKRRYINVTAEFLTQD